MAAAQDLKDLLLPFIGKAVGATLGTTDDKALMAAVNKALMELLGQRLTKDVSELVRAPMAVTIDQVTADSKGITFTGWQDWMLGCSVQMGSTWNRFASAAALESEYSGDTEASVAATVYQDAVNLDVAVESLMGPVTLDKQWQIQMVPNREVLAGVRQGRNFVGNVPMGQPGYALMVDSLVTGAGPVTRFVFDSAPVAKFTLNFTAALKAPQITAWNDSTTFFLPGGRDTEILEPVARWKLSSYPQFIGDRGEAREEYVAAMQKWASYSNKGVQPGVLDLYGC